MGCENRVTTGDSKWGLQRGTSTMRGRQGKKGMRPHLAPSPTSPCLIGWITGANGDKGLVDARGRKDKWRAKEGDSKGQQQPPRWHDRDGQQRWWEQEGWPQPNINNVDTAPPHNLPRATCSWGFDKGGVERCGDLSRQGRWGTTYKGHTRCCWWSLGPYISFFFSFLISVFRY